MLKFWELSPSPNNTKVRMALRYKGIEFEAVPVDPSDRSKLIEVTGQELTPSIEDKGIVLNDSEAILQYLDANYRDAPRLYPAERATRRQCEAWKDELDEKVAKHWFPPFMHAVGYRDELDGEAVKAFADALAWLDGELGDKDSFHGPERAIDDLRVAEWATYAFPGAGLLARVPHFARFKEIFGLAEGSLPNLERFLVPWNERLA
jgi:glutathione S-transferase